MRLSPARTIRLLMAAGFQLCIAVLPAMADVLPPPPCNTEADACDRLSWIEHVLWTRDKNAIPHLRTMASGDSHARTRERSLGTLATLGDIKSQVVFQDRLAFDSSPSVRRAAAEGFGLLKVPGPMNILTESLQNDSDFLVRAECARALGRMRRTQAVPFLSFALLRDPSSHVRALSAEALSRLRTPDATAPLLQGAQDADPLVRLYAVRGLVETDPPTGLPLFRQIWETARDPELRLEAFRGLLNTEEHTRWRVAGLADPEERIRFLALQDWLIRLGGRESSAQALTPGALKQIEGFLSDRSRGIREIAKSFLEKQGFRVRPSGFIYVIQN